MGLAIAAALAVVALACALAAPAAATVPLGDQFRVSNAGTDGDVGRSVSRPALVVNSTTAEYLAVWEGEGLVTPNEVEIFGQLVSPTGAELGGDFRISNTGTDGDILRSAHSPEVAYNPLTNEYLVVWRGDGLATNGDVEVFGQRLSATGAEIGGDFQISTTGANGDTARGPGGPVAVYNPEAGEYLVTWDADGLATDGEFEIFAQRLSGTGAELGGDFRVSTTSADTDANRDAADPSAVYNDEANEYLVAWEADGLSVDNEFEIFVQRLSSAGAEVGGDLRVTTTGTDGSASHDATVPSLAYHPQANEYLVAWEADGLATEGEVEIFARRLSALALPIGGQLRVSTVGADADEARDASAASAAFSPPAGEYLISWYADALLTDGETEVFAQRLSAAGAELGGDIRVSTTGVDGDSGAEAFDPSLTFNAGSGEFLVGWDGDALPTDDEEEIFARRLGPEPSSSQPGLPVEPPVAIADTVAPVVSGLALSRKRFRVGSQSTPVAAAPRRRARPGTTIRYRSSEGGTATFTIERVVPGRVARLRGRRRCVTPTRRLVRTKARRCTRHRPAGRLTRAAATGANRLVFSGRVGRRALRPGPHRLTLRVNDAARNGSAANRLQFTIVRR